MTGKEVFKKLKTAAKIVFGTPIALAVAFLFIVLFGAGGPVVFLMFFAVYGVIGPLLQLLVRAVPQDHPANQPTPWPQYWALALTITLRTGAILAVFRLLFWISVGPWIAEDDPGNLLFAREVEWFFGGCGLIYAFMSFEQEGLWLYRQLLAVRDLPTSTVASAALGLAELSGSVRHPDNREGPLDTSREVMSFYWQILGTEKGPEGETMLGTYDKNMRPFYVDDGTGRILVDPVYPGVELRRPLISALTTFFGRRSFEILLTRHTRRPSWDQRNYSMKEGDMVRVIGCVEVNPGAPQDAAGPDRLMVRPREEARAGFESLLQFLIPGRTPARTPQDIFIISDANEELTKGLLRKNFVANAAMSVVLALISVLLVILRSRPS